MSNQILLTQEGFVKLRAELDKLKSEDRRNVADAIREAKSHGDLKENAAYHEAKLNQTRLEGRIADLEKVLELAHIIERPDHDGVMAHLGSRVTIRDLDFDDQFDIQLVGSFEADPANDLISITSPLGSALLMREEGEEVEVDAPAGKQRYRIEKIL